MTVSRRSVTLTPVREEIEKTLGVFFIGYVAATVIFGFNIFQAWRYSSRYSLDPTILKAFIGVVCLLDMGATALVSHALYGCLIDLFPATTGLSDLKATFCAESLLAVIAVFLVQSHCTYQLWSASRRAGLVIVIQVIVFIALAMGIVRSLKLIQHRQFEVMGGPLLHFGIAIGRGFTFLAGLILSAAQYLSYPAQPQEPDETGSKTHDWFSKFVLHVITRFGLANVVQLGYLITFIAKPKSAYWLPFHLCATKLYVNGFLNGLNDRPAPHHGHGSDERETAPRITLPRQSFTFAGAQSSSQDRDIRNKSTIQALEIPDEAIQQTSRSCKLGVPLTEADDISDYTWDPSRDREDTIE